MGHARTHRCTHTHTHTHTEKEREIPKQMKYTIDVSSVFLVWCVLTPYVCSLLVPVNQSINPTSPHHSYFSILVHLCTERYLLFLSCTVSIGLYAPVQILENPHMSNCRSVHHFNCCRSHAVHNQCYCSSQPCDCSRFR